MSNFREISDILERLQDEHPVGFAIGLHVTYTSARFLFQTYSRDWMEEYSRRGFIMTDPTVQWGLSNDGWVRWSDLVDTEDGVLPTAKKYGLLYGMTTATTDQGTKSIASFASNAREYSDEEAASLAALTARMHALTIEGEMDPKDEDRLRKLAVSSTHG